MPCSSSAPDTSPVHVIEIEDDFPPSPVQPEQENLVDDTGKEQEAANVSLTRSEDDDDVTERKIHGESALNSEQREAVNEGKVTEGEVHAESSLNSVQRRNKRKTPYSIKFGELPQAIRKFLASVKRFFIQKVNFEREKAPVTLSTYDKA